MIRNRVARSFFLGRTEEVMQVNSLNQRIGKVYRSGMKKELYFRTCNIFLLDSNGKLVVQQRASHINPFPLYWDAAPGGVVRFSETDSEAAKREIFEEMSVEVQNLEKLATLSIENEGWFWWCSYFVARFKGTIQKSKDVEDYKFLNVKELKDWMASGEKFTPGCLAGIKLLKDR